MHRIARLTERQKQCLRLKYENMSAKEIGRELGLSPDTVNDHFKKARVLFGANDTMAVARILAKAEDYQRMGAQQLAVEIPTIPDNSHKAGANQPARNRYNLTALQRIGLILLSLFLAIASAGALLAGSEVLTRLFLEYEIDISDPPYRN